MDRRLDSIGVIESFFGEELTTELGAAVMRLPSRQFEVLIDQLDAAYTAWAEDTSSRPGSEATLIFHNMLDYGLQGEPSKSLLAYFPGQISITDPLTEHIYVSRHFLYDEQRSLVRSIDDKRFRRQVTDLLRWQASKVLAQGIVRLSEIRSLVASRDILLIPGRYVAPAQEVAKSLRTQLNEAHPHLVDIAFDDPVWNTMPDANEQQIVNRRLQRNSCFVREMALGQFLDFSPVATDRDSAYIMDRALRLGPTPTPVLPGVYVRIAKMLGQFRIPALDGIPYADLARLRAHEEAFARFRSAFIAVLDKVQAEGPGRDDVFQVEFNHWADELLLPEVERINKARRASNALQQFVTGGMALGAGVVTSIVTGSSPVGTIAGVGAAQVSWLLYPLLRRLTIAGRSEALFRKFYGYLVSDS